MVLISPIKVDAKQIIIFSHREYSVIRLWVNRDNILREYLLRNYNVIVNVGWFHKVFEVDAWVDKVFSSPSNILSLKGCKNKVLPVNSRDVLPEEFINNNLENGRDIDVVYICNNSYNKRARDFFDFVKSSQDLNFALMLSYPEGSSDKKFDNALLHELNDYVASKKSNLLFLDGKIVRQRYRFSRQDVANLLSRSKIYLHMCRREGESRSMGEALSQGCYLMAHRDFLGGGNDILSEDVSSRFAQKEDLTLTIKASLNEINSYYNRNKYLEIREYNLELLERVMREMGLSDREIESFLKLDLSMVLPSHNTQYDIDGLNICRFEDFSSLSIFKKFCDGYDFPVSGFSYKTSRMIESFKKIIIKVKSTLAERHAF